MSRRATLVILILGMAVFGYLVWDCGIGTILAGIAAVGWRFVPIVALWGIVYGLNAIAWYLLMEPRDRSVGLGTLFRLSVSAFALNYITPFVNLGGEPYRVLALREAMGFRNAASSVMLYNIVHMGAHCLFWLVAIAAALAMSSLPIGMAVPLAITGVVLVTIIGFVISRRNSGLFHFLLEWRWLHRWLPRASKGIDAHREGLIAIDGQVVALFHQRKGVLLGAVVLEFTSRVIASMEFLLILGAAGQGASFLQAVYINALSSLILNILFFVPYELGAREGGLSAVLIGLGYPGGLGVTTGIINRVRELVWIVIGLSFLLKTVGTPERGTLMDLMEAKEGR